jgi:hypothetical protein
MKKDKPKQWGIIIDGKWWIEEDGKPSIYQFKRQAQQDADDFNSMRKKGDTPYQVKEYK